MDTQGLINSMSKDGVDLQPLYEAINHHKMMEFWGDGLFVKTEADRKQRAQRRASEATDIYVKIMNSDCNDGSEAFQLWAIRTALGLRTSCRYTAQAIGGKHWRFWGTHHWSEDLEDNQ